MPRLAGSTMTQALALSTRRVTIRYILFYSACLPVKATTEIRIHEMEVLPGVERNGMSSVLPAERIDVHTLHGEDLMHHISSRPQPRVAGLFCRVRAECPRLRLEIIANHKELFIGELLFLLVYFVNCFQFILTQ